MFSSDVHSNSWPGMRKQLYFLASLLLLIIVSIHAFNAKQNAFGKSKLASFISPPPFWLEKKRCSPSDHSRRHICLLIWLHTIGMQLQSSLHVEIVQYYHKGLPQSVQTTCSNAHQVLIYSPDNVNVICPVKQMDKTGGRKLPKIKPVTTLNIS